MPSVADLDKPCRFCGDSISEHCRHVEGAAYFTPCWRHLLTLAPVDWLRCVNGDGLCLECSRPVGSHFTFQVPQAAVRFGAVTVQVLPAGNLVARVPVDFTDCR